MDVSIDALIKKEKSKIVKLCAGLSKEKSDIANRLADQAAFMCVTLNDMQCIINKEGKTITMSQGSYEIERVHPLLVQYNAMIKNYAAVIKQICEIAPEGVAQKAGDDLMNFITK